MTETLVLLPFLGFHFLLTGKTVQAIAFIAYLESLRKLFPISWQYQLPAFPHCPLVFIIFIVSCHRFCLCQRRTGGTRLPISSLFLLLPTVCWLIEKQYRGRPCSSAAISSCIRALISSLPPRQLVERIREVVPRH